MAIKDTTKLPKKLPGTEAAKNIPVPRMPNAPANLVKPAPMPKITPTPTTVQGGQKVGQPIQGEPKPTIKAPIYQPAEKQYADLIQQAKQNGLDDVSLQSGLNAFNSGVLNNADVERWLNKFVKPQDETEKAIDKTVDDIKDDTTPVETKGAIEAGEEKAKQAEGEYSETMETLKDTYKESLDVTTKTAEDKHTTEVQILNESLALQQQLAAQQSALIESGAAIQKQELKNAYDANKAAVDLQKKKVAEAYEAMKIEQGLLNKQRQIREETSLGLIYGGFGSVAANKNLEETVMQGEREIVKLKQDAVNKDTEFQNQVVSLNSAYELDSRKIEQWKAEESNKIYSSLQQYVQEIKSDKMMAATEKAAAINQAVADYNVKVAEIQTTVSETRFSLARELLIRSDTLRQQDIQNELAKAREARDVESFEYEQNRNKINDARTDLDLVLTNYFKEDYDKLPPDVLAQIDKLEKEGNLPTGASKQIMEMAKEADVKAGDVTREFTDETTGEVSVIKYNFQTGKVETMKLGKLETPVSQWEMDYNSDTGAYEQKNKSTGEFVSSTPFTGELPAEFGEGQTGGWCGDYASKVSTAPPVGNQWNGKGGKKEKITHYDNPGIGDKLLLPLGVKTDGKGYGHVATVIGYNPTTGIIDVVESNRDGRQTDDPNSPRGIVTKGTYNIKDIQGQGGGFVAGSLKEPYYSALMKSKGATGAEDVQTYIGMAKQFGTDYARSRLKEMFTGDQQRQLLAQFEAGVQAPTPGIEVPEVPYVGGILEDIVGPKPSILEQEQIDKDKKKGGTYDVGTQEVTD